MKKEKHDHRGTKLLKLSIFTTLMLAPFMAVLFKCAYVTFNKNAYQSYSGGQTEIVETQTNFTDMVIGEKYTFKTDELFTFEGGISPTPNRVDLQVSDLSLGNFQHQAGILSFLYYSSGQTLRVQFNNGVNNDSYYSNQWSFNFIFTLDNINNLGNFSNYINQYLYHYQESVSDNYLDNAFYYAVDEAMESPYFAWARNNALYTTTSAFTTGLGINTQAIPTLMVYWLILTLIYIVIDIVLELFIYLTHNFMDRTR